MDLPVACALSREGRDRRGAELREIVGAATVTLTDSPEGMELEFDGGGSWLPKIAAFIAAERRCCRFLRFELVAEAALGPIRLRMSGPPGTRAFLEDLFSSGRGSA